MNHLKEKSMRMVFMISACASILSVAMICIFLFANGIPAIGKIGIFDFLLGEKWKPGNDIYGILPMILGSIYVTAGAIVVGVPIGILTAIFMSRFCPRSLYRIMKPAIDLLAGIPSVVYGFFGSDCSGHVKAFWRKRKEYGNSFCSPGNYDSSYDYRGIRISN